MKLGIMQPYFFPYLGYFDLINRCDQWVVFDIVNYKNKSWMNRNRILHPTDGWQYISLPVQKSFGQKIKDTHVIDSRAARDKILGQLQHYKKTAPYFNQVCDLVNAAFDVKSKELVDHNVKGLAEVCQYLGIDFDYIVASQENLSLPDINHPGHWALEISDLLNAEQYINPIGGQEIFDKKLFDDRGIDLKFTAQVDFGYETPSYKFEPHLSIVDVMLWNSPSKIKETLDLHTEAFADF